VLMNYHIGCLVLSSLCVGAFVAADIWWCSFCRLQPAKRIIIMMMMMMMMIIIIIIIITSNNRGDWDYFKDI